MIPLLETTVDKFTFRVPTDRLYTPDGLWVFWLEPADSARVLLGLTDYLQQSSGDLAFVEVRPVGTLLAAGDDLGSVETIKVNLSLPSPFDGVVVDVNPSLAMTPELVNRDPYGAGWLVSLELTGGAVDTTRLMQPDAYLAHMRAQAETEVSSQ
jgi:glycine cleavage system H protein